jgi:hypothetical protein
MKSVLLIIDEGSLMQYHPTKFSYFKILVLFDHLIGQRWYATSPSSLSG